MNNVFHTAELSFTSNVFLHLFRYLTMLAKNLMVVSIDAGDLLEVAVFVVSGECLGGDESSHYAHTMVLLTRGVPLIS